jgi:hypothetical protein
MSDRPRLRVDTMGSTIKLLPPGRHNGPKMPLDRFVEDTAGNHQPQFSAAADEVIRWVPGRRERHVSIIICGKTAAALFVPGDDHRLIVDGNRREGLARVVSYHVEENLDIDAVFGLGSDAAIREIVTPRGYYHHIEIVMLSEG